MAIKKSNANHMLEKAAITGVTTGIMASQMFPGAQYVLPALISSQPTEVPFVAIATGIGALNSVVCDAMHLGIQQGVPLPKKAADLTTFGASVASSAITMYLLLRLGSVNIGLVNSAITGAVGEVAGGLSFYYLKENQYL